MRVKVARTFIFKYPLPFIEKLGYDIEPITSFFKEFRAIATHLYWCKRLGIDPFEDVVNRLYSLPSYFHDCILDVNNSQKYLLKEIVKVTRPKRALIRLNPMVSVDIYPKQKHCIVVNLEKGELWVRGFYKGRALKLPLSRKACKYLRKILTSSPSKTATLVLRNGILEIHLYFTKKSSIPYIRLPLMQGKWIIAVVDMNSRYGMVCTWLYLDCDKREWKIIRVKKYRRKNLTSLLKYTSKIQKTRDRLRNIGSLDHNRKLLYNKIVKSCLRRQRTINKDFIAKTTKEVVLRTRRIAKRYKAQPLIVVDKPIAESLKATPLQWTLLRFAKILKCKALWYEVPILFLRLSSSYCPYCNEKLTFRKHKHHRIGKCNKCGFKSDRDIVPVYYFISKFTKTLRS